MRFDPSSQFIQIVGIKDHKINFKKNSIIARKDKKS